jgi:D-alanyl-D-alanine dipeptidase
MRELMIIFLCSVCCACSEKDSDAEQKLPVFRAWQSVRSVSTDVPPLLSRVLRTHSLSDTMERQLIRLGLVDIRTLDSSVHVDLKYAGTDNFSGTNLYGDFHKAYLPSEVASKVLLAQQLLRKKLPYCSLIIFDAVRPLHIQKRMWDSLRLPPGVKQQYLCSPTLGSLHNYGAAVDVGIVYDDGKELDMGTQFDFFGDLAQPAFENKLLEEGRLSYRQILNRETLREVMRCAGMQPIETEWWHFNSCSRVEAAKRYPLVE